MREANDSMAEGSEEADTTATGAGGASIAAGADLSCSWGREVEVDRAGGDDRAGSRIAGTR